MAVLYKPASKWAKEHLKQLELQGKVIPVYVSNDAAKVIGNHLPPPESTSVELQNQISEEEARKILDYDPTAMFSYDRTVVYSRLDGGFLQSILN